jgi:hypothetical protein
MAPRLVNMFDDCLVFEDKRTLNVCEEKRTKITFYNATGEMVAKIRVDGCVIADNTVKKCDYFLLCATIKKAILVELKGKEVVTAIEQLSATLDNEKLKIPLKHYEKRAYAVITGNPIPLSKIQNIQAGFNKRHHQCTLRVVKSSNTYDLLSGKLNGRK